MPVYVRWRRPTDSRKTGVFRAAQLSSDNVNRMMSFNPLGLVWIHVPDAEAGTTALPVVRRAYNLDVGCGAINQDEAEQATGLHEPVCWDKIMDEL